MSTASFSSCATPLNGAPVPPAPLSGRDRASRRTIAMAPQALRHPLAVGVAVIGLLFWLAPGHAQDAAPPASAPSPVTTAASEGQSEPARSTPRIAGSGPTPCVQVDIAGHRAGHLDCATQALAAGAETARREAQAARDISVPQAGSSDLQVGVASRSGTRLRLRENFGTSIRPPAAPTPAYPSPVGPRR